MPTYPTYKLGEICELLNGYAFKSSKYVQRGLRVIRITNVKKGYVIDEEPQFYPIETREELKKYILKKDDLLISLTGNVGRVGILNEKLLPAALNQRVGCLRIKDKSVVSLQYLYHLLNTNSFEKDCINSSRGIAQKNMSTEWLKDYEVSLPPLPTQHQIVSRIEALFAELDKAVEHLRTAQQQLKIYRQAVLNHWLNNDDGKWETVKLGEVAEIVTGNTPPKKDMSLYGNDYPFYKPTDLNAGINTIHAEDNVSVKGFNASRKLPKGSVLVTCIGATIGKTGLIHREGICNQQINAILPNDNFIPKCLYYIVISDSFQRQIKSNASATTLPILNKSKFSDLEFRLPPLPEQQRIVKEIETRLSQAEAAEARIAEALQKTEALRQSILKKAFSGEFDL